ncbi:MAG: cytochrome c [Ignavibacteria bacterium]|nr:cytochrome c [Ignavibacteria bacterium]
MRRASRSAPNILRRVVYVAAVVLATAHARAQEAADYFRQNCLSCHTIGGGRLSGPDLKNVSSRKDRAWLVKFMLDPKGMIETGDPYAAELLRDARGTVMPLVAGMSRQRAESLLDLIDAESLLDKSQFVGITISDRPFTQRDIDLGKEIFVGTTSLTNAGPSCISCHTVPGLGGFGGGTLAPDLTTVFERYEGRKTLATWLSAPATPTMQSVYKSKPLDPDEVLAMVAYFQHTLQRNPEDASTARLNFVLIGLGGAVLLLGLFDVFWNKRFRAVRRPLIHASKLEKTHE